MAKWYHEDPEYTQISTEDKILRDKIVAILDTFTQEMEGYSYFGSNPGIDNDDYEDVADALMDAFAITTKENQ